MVVEQGNQSFTIHQDDSSVRSQGYCPPQPQHNQPQFIMQSQQQQAYVVNNPGNRQQQQVILC